MRFGACLIGLVFLASCHDAPRDNLFDPVLTPPVELSVALNDTAGTATLTWTPYAGTAPFAEYRVLRNIDKSTVVDTLARITDVQERSYVDTVLAQHTPYVYRVSVVNTRGFEVPSTAQGSLLLELPPVQLLSAEFDSRTATAKLGWSRYAGPGFHSYQVRRRTSTIGSQVVKELADSTVTSLVDSNLVGATEYYYQVVVLTERGEELPSAEKSGSIHALVATWPLEVEGSGDNTEYVRLYAQPGGRIAALLTNHERVRLLWFASGGRFLEEQRLLERLPWTDQPPITDPRSASMALTQENKGLLLMAGRGMNSGLLAFAPDGALVWREHLLFADQFPEPLEGEEGKVQGEVGLLVRDNPESGGEFFIGQGFFGKVEVSTAGRLLFQEDFSGFPEAIPRPDLVTPLEVQGWSLLPRPRASFFGTTANRRGWFNFAGYGEAMARRTDPSWQDFRLQAEVIPVWGETGIQVGGEEYSSFSLGVDVEAQQVYLDWSFTPPAGQGGPSRTTRWTAPFPVVQQAVANRLSLEVVQGRVRAAVESPVIWAGHAAEGIDPSAANSLAALGDAIIGTSDEWPLFMDAQQQVAKKTVFDGWVNETRARQVVGERFARVGICLPDQDQVRWGKILRAANWHQAVTKVLGPRLELPVGHLFYPLSMDIGPDGRMYLLDAGNGRILAFDADGNYLTHWGQPGKALGEFDFGSGARLPVGLNFDGSICVDDEGYIYVADVFNQRIQKFAP